MSALLLLLIVISVNNAQKNPGTRKICLIDAKSEKWKSKIHCNQECFSQ